MNSILPAINPATASVAELIAWVMATFFVVNRYLKLSGDKALIAAFAFGVVTGGFVYGYQHPVNWTANIFALLIEAASVGAGAVSLYAAASVPVKAVGAWGSNHATQAKLVKRPVVHEVHREMHQGHHSGPSSAAARPQAVTKP